MNVRHPSSDDLKNSGDEIVKLKRSDGATHEIKTLFSRQSTHITAQAALKAVNEKIADAAAEMEKKHATSNNNPIQLKRSDGDKDCVIRLASKRSDTNLGAAIANATSAISSVFSGKGSGLSKGDGKGSQQQHRSSFGASKEIGLASPKDVRIVHFSDTFGLLSTPVQSQLLPRGDIMVHSGNFSLEGDDREYRKFNEWLGAVASTYHYRIIVVGNKDVKKLGVRWDEIRSRLTNATHVLLHSQAKVLGISFYGVPWNNFYGKNHELRSNATPKSTSELNNRYDEIPSGTDVLITHAPAHGRLDLVSIGNGQPDQRWGSRDLAEELKRVKPGLHLVGHVREGRGYLEPFGKNALTVNACMCNHNGDRIISAPLVVLARQLQVAMHDDCSGTWSFEVDSLI